jgi:hypothetical protein
VVTISRRGSVRRCVDRDISAVMGEDLSLSETLYAWRAARIG